MGNTISNAGHSANNMLRQAGKTIERDANALQSGINGAEKVAGQYVQDRGERLEGIGEKLSSGHILDAAMDAFQAVSLGGSVSDMAHAMGMVESPADRALLSGVVNAMTGNLVAAMGDGEDFLQNMQPRLQQAQHTIDGMDISINANANVNVEMAGSQYVPGPMSQLRASMSADLNVSVRQSEDPRPAHGGYAGGRVRGRVDFGKIRGQMVASGRFQFNLSAGMRAGRMPTVVTMRFAESLPGLTAYYANPAISNAQAHPAMPGQSGTAGTSSSSNTQSSNATSSTQASAEASPSQATDEKPAISNEAMSNMLSNPNLSFEDKLFMFMLAMAKNQEKKLEKLMGRYKAAKKAKEESGKAGKTEGKTETTSSTSAQSASSTSEAQATSSASNANSSQTSTPQLPEFGMSNSGKAYPKGGKNDSMLGGIVDMVKGFDAGAVRMIGQAAPMAAPALGAAIGAALGSVFPGLGTAIGGMVGGMLGDMLAKEIIPQACDQIATGIESGDFDWFYKGIVVADANLLLPGLGTALAVEDSGAMGLLGPAGVAINDLSSGQDSQVTQSTQTQDGGKSAKARKAAAKHKAKQEAKAKAKATAHAKAKAATQGNKTQEGANANKPDEGKTTGVTGSNDSKAGDGLNSASSDQEWMMHLQKAQEDLTKMYQMLSNSMKSMHDTQMTAVRNIR